MKYLLVSVFDREIEAQMYPFKEVARHKMMDQLHREFLEASEAWDDVDDPEALWRMLSSKPAYNDGWFGFCHDSAYFNMDSGRDCDWKIIPIEDTEG